jgi:hypothetical protein
MVRGLMLTLKYFFDRKVTVSDEVDESFYFFLKIYTSRETPAVVYESFYS